MPKVDDRVLSTLPTVSGYISRAAYARLKKAGVDVNRLLKTAKLTERQIVDPSARFSARSQINFLQLAAAALRDEYLGIHLAQSFDLRELGLLYYVQASSNMLGDALQRAARYSTIINESVKLEYCAGKNISIALKYLGVSRHADQQQIEFFVTTILRICRELSGRRVVPIRIQLAHRRKNFPADFQRLAGCKIEFGKPVDEIIFPKSVQQIPLLDADPYLNVMLVKYCDQAVSGRSPKSGGWRSKLENAMAPLLPHGKANLAVTSDSLGVSRRTLARRLSSEGLTFKKVLEKLRSDLAAQYLKEKDLSISTIAWLLGYREISAFTRACKRWTGKTPREMRTRQDQRSFLPDRNALVPELTEKVTRQTLRRSPSRSAR